MSNLSFGQAMAQVAQGNKVQRGGGDGHVYLYDASGALPYICKCTQWPNKAGSAMEDNVSSYVASRGDVLATDWAVV